MSTSVKKELDKFLISDLINIIIQYIQCKECKNLVDGKIRCICGNYMCKCNGQNICKYCKKVICNECLNKHLCCYIVKDPILCTYCSAVFSSWTNNNTGHICLFEDCQDRMCKKCWRKFGNLCRGHILLKIKFPKRIEFKGII